MIDDTEGTLLKAYKSRDLHLHLGMSEFSTFVAGWQAALEHLMDEFPYLSGDKGTTRNNPSSTHERIHYVIIGAMPVEED